MFYICQADGRQDGFLCPNGTKFNQQFLVCDWWYNVDCSIADSFFTVNERIYAGPGSRAVEFPDQNSGDTSQGQQLSNAAGGLQEDTSVLETVRGESFGDASVPAPDADSIVTPSSGVGSDYDEGTEDYAGGISATDGAISDYVEGSADYDGLGGGQVTSTRSSLDGPPRNDDSYSYLPPDEFFPTEATEGVRGATGEEILVGGKTNPNTEYGIPTDFSVLPSVITDSLIGPVSSKTKGELDNVTTYNYFPPDETTGASPTTAPRNDDEDFPATSSAFDESTIEAILGHAGNLGGFPGNGHSGYSYPEPLNPLNFESIKTDVVPEDSTFISAAVDREESELTTPTPNAGLPLAMKDIVNNGYNYSPPSTLTGEVPLPSNPNDRGTGASSTETSNGNRYHGYSYREPAQPFLFPGESPVLPLSESYLPPTTR